MDVATEPESEGSSLEGDEPDEPEGDEKASPPPPAAANDTSNGGKKRKLSGTTPKVASSASSKKRKVPQASNPGTVKGPTASPAKPPASRKNRKVSQTRCGCPEGSH